MARVAWMMRLKPGGEEKYKEFHDNIWPELVENIRSSGVRNYSIFRRGLDLFAYLESEGDGPNPAGSEGRKVDPVTQRWWKELEPYMECEPDASPKMWPLDEVFHLD